MSDKNIKLLTITLTCLILLSAAADSALARDYMFKSVPNRELYSDMMAFTEKFADDVKGTQLERKVRHFAAQQKKIYAKDTLAWIGNTFDFVTHLKEEFPPVAAAVRGTETCAAAPSSDPGQAADAMPGIIRRDIMMLLDFPFHTDELSEGVSKEQKARYTRARNSYLCYWRERFLEWLSSPRPKAGTIEFCKVYSSGYIFRTEKHTLGIDIRWDGTYEEAEKIGKELDVLLITHPHNDHMSPLVMQAMTKRKKIVVVPCENGYSDLVLTPSEATVFWTGTDHLTPEKIGPVTLRAAMGDQGPKIPCNVYYAEMDGWTIAAKGDNAPKRAEEFLADLPRPDFTIVPVFSYINRILGIEAQAPETSRTTYLLPCHENEYHHKVAGRVGYRYLYGSPDRSTLNAPDYPESFPYILMDAGESVTVSR